jgi:hypothetical protein
MEFYQLHIEKPDQEICQKYGVVNGPVYVGASIIWAAEVNKDTPIYAVYYGGTNNFVILRKYENSEWEEIEYAQVDNLYGFIWHLIARDTYK